MSYHNVEVARRLTVRTRCKRFQSFSGERVYTLMDPVEALNLAVQLENEGFWSRIVGKLDLVLVSFS